MPEPEVNWRLFIALPVAQSVVQALTTAQMALKRALPHAKIRWTPPHQFHLTLQFLGEVPAADVPMLQACLQTACDGQTAIPLRLQALGFFPHAERPRVLWAGLEGQLNALNTLQKTIAHAMAPWLKDNPPEENFSAHITLARIKHLTPRERNTLLQSAQQAAPEPVAWLADCIQLMRSTLSSQGAHHECLAAWKLLPPRAPAT